MQKFLLLSAFALASFASAQQQKVEINFGAGVVTLQDCTRHGTDVDCTFLVKNPKSPQLASSYQSYNFKATIPNGQTFSPGQFKASSGNWGPTWNFNVRTGMTVSGTVRFPNVPGDTISRLSFAGSGEFTDIKIIQPQSASRLPGLSSMRQQTRMTDTFYMALLHGCYPTTSGKASCLVTLLADKPVAKVSGDTTAYSGGVLIQLDNVDVVDGKTGFTIGTATFKDVPVH